MLTQDEIQVHQHRLTIGLHPGGKQGGVCIIQLVLQRHMIPCINPCCAILLRQLVVPFVDAMHVVGVNILKIVHAALESNQTVRVSVPILRQNRLFKRHDINPPFLLVAYCEASSAALPDPAADECTDGLH